jgi:acetoin utilization protein AcuB
MRVGDRMQPVAVSVPPTASLADAQRAMVAHRASCLPVVEDGRLVGLVGDLDLAAAWPSPATTLTVGEATYQLTTVPVSTIMRPDPPVLVPDTPLAEAAMLLRDEGLGALPVVEKGRLVGLLSADDLVALMASGTTA